MNKRVLELANSIPGTYDASDEFCVKFAELIVRECMKVCKKTEQYEVGNQDPDEVGCIRAGASFCREDIKEHFGVE